MRDERSVEDASQDQYEVLGQNVWNIDRWSLAQLVCVVLSDFDLLSCISLFPQFFELSVLEVSTNVHGIDRRLSDGHNKNKH